ncbi:hypothetical protein MN116_005189 [Schistosoma mekongi]|uniref:Small lysine-rich protein 1 n=1 Tax=Schistosoma mekongi TaxID=38744 RepID=A0AAE2D5D0_SCHME|nr:hypothetical protein MN116_005189 [Schistosoma mekongi]
MPKTKGKQRLKMRAKKRSGKGKRSGLSRQKRPKREVNIIGKHAMENLYYIAHNAPSALIYRGFQWSGSKLKSKGKRKGRKRKK